MSLTPVPGERALIDDDGKTIIIGDLHLGFELTLLDKGVHIPLQDSTLLSMLNKILKRTGAERLVINGDVVDPIFRKWRMRWRLHDFLKGVRPMDIHLVKGNHDARIEEIVPDGIALHQSGGARFGDLAVCHGHRGPSPNVLAARTIVISHSHPVVALRDELGITLREPCWLRWRGKGREVIVLPPFNPFMGGHPVNSASRRQSVIFTRGLAKVERCEVYLLDGTHLGKVMDIMTRENHSSNEL